jgi:uncharacterized DUF497 family protein
MEFEWDENKNQTNLEKHSIDFNQAKEVFNDKNKIEIPDSRNDYGENRTRIIGKAIDLVLSVIFTMRGTVTRIISARVASRKERQLYSDKKQLDNGK